MWPDQVLRDDIVQLNGSHSWFKADENEDLAVLQQRLNEQDILLTAPLIGEEIYLQVRSKIKWF